MENGERAPFLTALTCIVGRFDIPDYDTFAEALLLKDDGGRVAVWSPAAFSMNESARCWARIRSRPWPVASHHLRRAPSPALDGLRRGGEGEADVAAIVTHLGDPATRVEW